MAAGKGTGGVEGLVQCASKASVGTSSRPCRGGRPNGIIMCQRHTADDAHSRSTHAHGWPTVFASDPTSRRSGLLAAPLPPLPFAALCARLVPRAPHVCTLCAGRVPQVAEQVVALLEQYDREDFDLGIKQFMLETKVGIYMYLISIIGCGCG